MHKNALAPRKQHQSQTKLPMPLPRCEDLAVATAYTAHFDRCAMHVNRLRPLIDKRAHPIPAAMRMHGPVNECLAAAFRQPRDLTNVEALCAMLHLVTVL